jgi:hypothetical protein
MRIASYLVPDPLAFCFAASQACLNLSHAGSSSAAGLIPKLLPVTRTGKPSSEYLVVPSPSSAAGSGRRDLSFSNLHHWPTGCILVVPSWCHEDNRSVLGPCHLGIQVSLLPDSLDLLVLVRVLRKYYHKHYSEQWKNIQSPYLVFRMHFEAALRWPRVDIPNQRTSSAPLQFFYRCLQWCLTRCEHLGGEVMLYDEKCDVSFF